MKTLLLRFLRPFEGGTQAAGSADAAEVVNMQNCHTLGMPEPRSSSAKRAISLCQVICSLVAGILCQ
jgi:hypothetical protein